MARDFERELANLRCWDARTQAIYLERGEPVDDVILQNRRELVALCQFIEQQQLRSYLEIGAWTGRLASALHTVFRFDQVAVCDDGYARRFGLELHLPSEATLFVGSSRSPEYLSWRRDLGHIDLVFIDADHSEAGVRADFERERAMPHRFLAFHDIANPDPKAAGVARFWQGLEGGHTRELRGSSGDRGLASPTMGIGLWCATRPEGIEGFVSRGPDGGGAGC
ncbi:MAG: class I SAM-dependent methyltransferase [Pseudomonadota bacterium]